MTLRKATIAGSLAITLGLTPSAMAQDAAETAIILSGSGSGQARAQQSLGSAISGSMRRATSAISVQPRGTPRSARGTQRQANAPQAIASDIDVLENTDAPGYTLRNGASIRVSGRLNPSATTVCTRNCPVEQAAKPGETGEETPAPQD